MHLRVLAVIAFVLALVAPASASQYPMAPNGPAPMLRACGPMVPGCGPMASYTGTVIVDPNCSQGATYIAALTSPTGTEQAAFKTAVCTLVALNLFQVIDVLHIHANTSAANAKVNAVSPGTHDAVQTGTLTFTADQGFTGDGSTGFLDTGFTPSTAGGHMALNSASFGVCIRNNRTTPATLVAYGATDASTGSYLLPWFSTINGGAINDAGNDLVNPGTGSSQGSWAFTRTASNVAKIYHNGVGLTTGQGAGSVSLPSNSIYELARHDPGGAGFFTTDQHAYFFMGAGLNASQVASIYNVLGNMMFALGDTSPCAVASAVITGQAFFATAGSDTNNCMFQSGVAPNGPCQTIAKANTLLLGPNSSLLFNGGDTFTGCLSITTAKASPNAGNPITISNYGTGRPQFTTNCSGGFSAGLTLDTVRGVNVSNIDFVQGGNTPATMACILIINTAGQVQSGDYTIQNNTCTGGFTSQGGGVSGLTGGGITIRGYSGNGCAPINNVTLRNNTIFGAAVTSADQNGIFASDGCTGPGNLNNWTAEGNLLFNLGGTNPNTGTNPGNGILFIDGSNHLQQFNLAHDNAWNCTVSPGCGVAFWNDQANLVTIQFSEAYNIQPGFSTAGTDFDCVDQDQGVTNGLIQYVYCHDNFGYGVTGVQAGTWGPNTVRYMITENDNKRTGDLTAGLISYFNNGGPGLLYIYNTTIWANHTTSPTRTGGYVNQNGWPAGGVFANNSISLTADSFSLFTPVACVNHAATTIAQVFNNNDYNNLSSVTQQFYTCGPGNTSIPFATWAASIAGGEAGTIQTAPGFVGSPPDAACTWTPNTIAKVSSSWPPSGCAASVALASGAQNAKSAGANLANSSWPGGAPIRDFYNNAVPGSGPCLNISAYGLCP